MKLTNTKIAIDNWANQVVEDAKKNLVSSNAVSSGGLYNSLSNTGTIVGKNSLQVGITMKDYGAFIDQGVSGIKKKYNTDFSYTTKMPPPSALDGWIVRKGLAPRQNGKFTGRKIDSVGFKKSIQFLVARSIFYNGIKPTHFLTDAVKDNVKELPDEIKKSFALDINASIDLIIKSNFKK
jgi:hypothetical protein